MRQAILACVAFMLSAAMGQTTTTVDALGQTVVEVITVDPVAGVPTTLTIATTTLTPVTTTIVNAAGATVVEVLSFNANNGLTATQVLSTLLADATTVPIDTDTTHGGVQGPPTTTISAGPTTYTYTTTNAAGVTIAVPDVFTPTVIPSRGPSTLTGGTVMAYSDWTSIVGTNTVATGGFKSGAARAHMAQSVYIVLGTMLAGAFGGAWLVL